MGIEYVLENYGENFGWSSARSSEAVSRTALDFLLNECLTVMVSIISWWIHGLGRILPCRDPMKPLSKRRFQTLLVVVEVKPPYNFISSFPQLVVYLAALHQSRLRRKRSDTSVYGVLSDGYRFTFVRITHNGSLEHSKCFDITQGDIETILGCMKYILEKSSPNVTCKMDGSESVGDEGDSDEEMDVDG